MEAMSTDDRIREREDGEHAGDGEHVVERLDAYRTGELDADIRARVEAHLESCGRCREELAALASWTAAVERGYEASRASAAGQEPDWAAQRSAIVARTSGRSRAHGRRPLARWAPQVALVAVAALIVGIVWRENPIEPEDLRRAPSERSAAAVGEGQDAGARRDEAAPPEAPARVEEPAATETRSAAETPAPRAEPSELEKLADREGDEARLENLDALADRAAEPARAAPAADVERFTREARTALGARDTAGARRALALWSDTLGAEGYVAGEPAILADSLRQFLERAE